MAGDNPTLTSLTFLLAVLGYALLTVTAILAARGRVPVVLWRVAAAIIVIHVALVWAVRYGWSLAQATRHGYTGFLIFHGALVLIVVSAFVPRRTAALVYVAFAIVSLGALGAVSRYEEVAQYAAVVIALMVAGSIGIVHGFRTRRAHG
jgi:hypothetical protein